MPTGPAQKPQAPEAVCPTCGGPLGKSPAGQQVLQRASQAMAQRARGGQQRPPGAPQGGGMPPRPGMTPNAAPGGAGGPQNALKAMLLRKIMQARQGGMPPQGR